MKKSIRTLLPIWFLFLTTIFLSPTSMFGQSSFEGKWEGHLDVQGIELDLIFDISAGENGVLICALDVPMQGAKGISASEVLVKEEELTIKFELLNANYTGRISENKKMISGTWTQNGRELNLDLSRAVANNETQSESFGRPQEPKAPFPYDISELHFHNESADNIELFGTLTMPKGDGPFPAVVLISGSGPQNRDEELMGHKPFWIIADHFSRNGIAVLRYDDRGVGHSQGDFSKATSEDFASDAAAAVKFLKQSPKIKTNQIGLCGHSEGGMIAPMAAADSDEYAFLILMAGPGQNIVELLLKQSELISTVMGEAKSVVEEGNRINRKIYETVAGAGSQEERKAKLKKIMKKEYDDKSSEEQKQQGSFEHRHEQLEAQLFNPWMEYFLSYDPSVNLKKVACPVLAINGEKDLQVTPKENLAAIEKALREGRCKDITTKELIGLNHLFQHSETGSPSEYGIIDETFAPEALTIMTEWILERLK